MAEENNKKVTLYSYRKAWFVEKKIYTVQNIVLPFPVNPYELLEFIAVAGIMLMAGRIFPVLEKIPAVIRYAVLPYIVVKYLMKLKLDGKNPFKYLMSLVPYFVTRKLYVEHFKAYPDKRERVKLNWFCSRG